MVEYLPRSAWGARAPKSGPGNMIASKVRGVAVHWPGMGSRRLESAAAVASALKSWQAFHMDDKRWSDIAYQVAIDQAGRAWTLRGFRTQSGANGDTGPNQQYGAILLVLGSGEHPSPAMIATTREVVADFRAMYRGADEIEPHSAVRPEGTDCPGDIVRGLISAGELEPGQTQEDWFDMATPEEIEAAVYNGTLRAHRQYGKELMKNEEGTLDTVIDETREHRKAELARLDKIAAGVSSS